MRRRLSSDTLKIFTAKTSSVSTVRHFFTLAYAPLPSFSPSSYW